MTAALKRRAVFGLQWSVSGDRRLGDIRPWSQNPLFGMRLFDETTRPPAASNVRGQEREAR
jgi:hypothetical protein